MDEQVLRGGKIKIKSLQVNHQMFIQSRGRSPKGGLVSRSLSLGLWCGEYLGTNKKPAPAQSGGTFLCSHHLSSQLLERMAAPPVKPWSDGSQGEHFPVGDFLFPPHGFLRAIVSISYSVYLGRCDQVRGNGRVQLLILSCLGNVTCLP